MLLCIPIAKILTFISNLRQLRIIPHIFELNVREWAILRVSLGQLLRVSKHLTNSCLAHCPIDRKGGTKRLWFHRLDFDDRHAANSSNPLRRDWNSTVATIAGELPKAVLALKRRQRHNAATADATKADRAGGADGSALDLQRRPPLHRGRANAPNRDRTERDPA